MDDASRRALRDLARRAEWRGQAGAAGAAQDAAALRDLGGDLRAALARAQEQGGETWSRQAVEHLAAYCLKARADWTPEQVAELSRLREDAVIALAPGPGESDALPPRDRSALATLAFKQSRFLALTAVGCVLLVVAVFLTIHFTGNGGAQPVAAASTTAAPVTTTPPATSATSATSPSTAATTVSSSPSAVISSTTTSTNTSRVTGIQITNTDNIPGNPPEVILTYTVTAAGTGDALIAITVNGSVPSQLASMEPFDESGQTSYQDLTQTIDLSQWCNQTVKVAISSGSITQSVNVAVSGC